MADESYPSLCTESIVHTVVIFEDETFGCGPASRVSSINQEHVKIQKFYGHSRPPNVESANWASNLF